MTRQEALFVESYFHRLSALDAGQRMGMPAAQAEALMERAEVRAAVGAAMRHLLDSVAETGLQIHRLPKQSSNRRFIVRVLAGE